MISQSFKGFENIYTNIRMFIQMTFILLMILFAIQVVFCGVIIKVHFDKISQGMTEEQVCYALTHMRERIRNKFVKDDSYYRNITVACGGEKMTVTYGKFESFYENSVKKKVETATFNIFKILKLSAFLYILYPIILIYLSQRHKEEIRDKYLRGSKKVDPNKFNKLIDSSSFIEKLQIFLKNKSPKLKFKITEKVAIPEKIVTRHTFIIGRPGTGKTQTVNRIIEQLLKAKRKAIIHDFKGDFISTFYDPQKHLLFNPMDTRHLNLNTEQSVKGWTIFNEFESTVDVDAFCSSLIQSTSKEDPFWPSAARQLFKSILISCINTNRKTYADLWEMTNMDNESLLALFRKTPGTEQGRKLLTEAKTANNIITYLANFTAPIEYCLGTDGNFSIKEWIRDPNPDQKVIFLSNMAMIQETIKPFLTMFIDFANKSLCSLPDDLNRRCYFILDEFGQLSNIGSIIQLLTQSRSKGGAVIISIQDIAQIDKIYGKDGSTSIINSCGNTISFAVKEEKTADLLSKQFGSQEIKQSHESKSMGVVDMKDSLSISTQEKDKRLVLPSEITSLEDLNFYIQLSGYPITRDKFNYRKFPQTNEFYIGRKDFDFDHTPTPVVAQRDLSQDNPEFKNDAEPIEEKDIDFDEMDACFNEGLTHIVEEVEEVQVPEMDFSEVGFSAQEDENIDRDLETASVTDNEESEPIEDPV